MRRNTAFSTTHLSLSVNDSTATDACDGVAFDGASASIFNQDSQELTVNNRAVCSCLRYPNQLKEHSMYRETQSGVTLIEMMITIAIVAIVMMLALPSFSTWLQNARIRNTAESILHGIDVARSEALRRNGAVSFVLTNNLPSAPSITPSTTGKNWIVGFMNAAGNWTAIQGNVGAESSGNSSGVVITADNATISFGGLARTTLAANTIFRITNTKGSCVANGGSMRCLNVVVTPGGQAKMCDPSVTKVGDSRACQ